MRVASALLCHWRRTCFITGVILIVPLFVLTAGCNVKALPCLSTFRGVGEVLMVTIRVRWEEFDTMVIFVVGDNLLAQQRESKRVRRNYLHDWS